MKKRLKSSSEIFLGEIYSDLFNMSSVAEKSLLRSRFLSWLIAFSIFLLISSSFSLLQLSKNSFFSKSILSLILVRETPFDPIPENPVKAPVSLDETSQAKDLDIQNTAPEEPHPSRTSDELVRYDKNLCDKSRALLKVYMYDLPPRFHFGLLGWKGNNISETWPSVRKRENIPTYPGGLNLQHSVEYWLTLDLLSSDTANSLRPCSSIRVQNSSEADVIFVPFFSSLSYNRNSKHNVRAKSGDDRTLQDELVDFLKGKKEWKRFNGRDHLIVAHHPNSMLYARKKLASCMFVLADFGRYSNKIANLRKDVIAPYKHMVRRVSASDSPSFGQLPILVYFQGAIYRKDGGYIRHELYYLLKGEKDVHFTFGSAQSKGIREASKGMASSKFCLNIAGDTPSSNRLFDAIASHCVPVIISDEIELPFEDVLDYSEFSVFVRAVDAVKKGRLLMILRGIKEEKWIQMWEKLKKISVHFEYQFPSQSGDAVDMIWQTISRKKMATRLNVHRENRYRNSQIL